MRGAQYAHREETPLSHPEFWPVASRYTQYRVPWTSLRFYIGATIYAAHCNL